MFNWVRRIARRRQDASLAMTRRVPGRGSQLRPLFARYDAAISNPDNYRHWANADGLSADAAASPEVRRILRNRCRYEVANNSYAKGIVLTLANDTVGTGPRLQMLSPDPVANRVVEREFNRWSSVVSLADKLRTMRMARAEDGEAFGLLTNNARVNTPVKLDLRLIEADQVATPDLTFTEPNAVDGIVFDESGNPIVYHVLRRHPGSNGARFDLSYDQIPAESIIHFYRCDRPGQSRGIPDITPALPLFAQLRRFTLAVIAAAETAANFAGILYTDAPAGGEADPAEPFEPIQLESRALVTMPGGWRMSQLEAQQPSTTYSEFKREILNEIARCLSMPYCVAAGNSSGFNYASGRLDHQTYFKSIRVEQTQIGLVILDRILSAWLDEAVLIEGYLPPSLRTLDADRGHQWFFDGHEHVDPLKEASAQATRLTNHTTTLANEYAKQGRDWESELRQRAKERQLMEELGLNVDATVAKVAPQPDQQHQEDQEDDAQVDQTDSDY
jgi:lambda family phage portal protein